MKVGLVMQCSNCGGVIQKDDKFCAHCGSKTEGHGENHSENNLERKCPACSEVVGENDLFCMNCGSPIEKSETQINSSIVATNYSNTNNHIEKEATESINFTEEAKNLFNSTTKSIGKLAGNDESLKLNLRDMFSEVFKHHNKHDSDEVFIAGTRNTTPHISEVSEEWSKPWVFSRVFIALAITFGVLWVLTNVLGNENSIPGMIFIGALTVPISGLIFFFESNAFKNISIFDVMKMFFIGGVFSLISTIILYNFVTFSDEFQFYGIMTIRDAFLVGLIEEIGKAIIVILFINYLKTNKILNGLLVGASIGAGFAVFETAGYILNSGLQSVDSLSAMTDVIVLRGWSSLGGHLVWAAIVGAAVVIAKGERQFEWSNILDKRFLFFFFASVILHCIWDTDITILGSMNLKMILLIIIAWLLVFILMKSGLTQVNKLREAYFLTEKSEA